MYYKYKVKSPAIAQILTSLVKHKKKALDTTYCQEEEADYIGPRTVFYFAEQLLNPKKDDNNLYDYFGFACPKSHIGENGVRISLEKMIEHIL